MTESPSRPYLLDTSAIMTLIEEEPGADRVEELLRTQGVFIPFLDGLEVYYVTLQERSQDEADRRLALIRQLPATWLDQVTETVLIRAGHFKARYRISLADAIIAAFAVDQGAILVHKDPEYRVLVTAVAQEELPAKGRPSGSP